MFVKPIAIVSVSLRLRPRRFTVCQGKAHVFVDPLQIPSPRIGSILYYVCNAAPGGRSCLVANDRMATTI